MERVTQVSGETARKRIKTGLAVRARLSLAGERLPAEFEAVADAMTAGTLGLDSAHAIIQGLSGLTHPVGRDKLQAAESELVAAATGATEASPVACAADEVRIQTNVWRTFLDQDGSEPKEEHAMLVRHLHIGRERDGLVGIRGALLPDVAAKLTTIMDACLSPKTGPAFLSEEEAVAAGRDTDPRTGDQQRHDVFAGIVDTAARCLTMPQLGGAAPVVAVAVTAEDLESGHGCGYIGEVPISMRAVRQFACTGGMQKIVFTENGRIIQLGSPERIFTPQQRRAIILRDGQCCAPGCHMPGASVRDPPCRCRCEPRPNPYRQGMVLCWFHHRTLDTSGWEFRMVDGSPK